MLLCHKLFGFSVLRLLFYYDVHNLPGDYDYLEDLLATYIFLCLGQGANMCLYLCRSHRLGQIYGKSCLTVEGNSVRGIVLYSVLFNELGERSEGNCVLMAQIMPQLLCDMRSEGTEHNSHRLKNLLLVAAQI